MPDKGRTSSHPSDGEVLHGPLEKARELGTIASLDSGVEGGVGASVYTGVTRASQQEVDRE